MLYLKYKVIENMVFPGLIYKAKISTAAIVEAPLYYEWLYLFSLEKWQNMLKCRHFDSEIKDIPE